MSVRVAVVIPARNEEQFIGRVISALLSQELAPEKIVIVNDGSTDRTCDVAMNYTSVEVLNMDDNRKFSGLGNNPALANVINRGLDALRDPKNREVVNYDYILKVDADHILPQNYISTIVRLMETNKNIAVCSGIIKGEEKRNQIPRGSGRIVRAEFWKQIGLCYPARFGFETYIIVKALQMGYVNLVLNDLVSITLRKTGTNYKNSTYVSIGRSHRALGYTMLYTLVKSLLLLKRNPKGAFYLLKGYFDSDVDVYDTEFRSFTRSLQHKRIKEYVARIRTLNGRKQNQDFT